MATLASNHSIYLILLLAPKPPPNKTKNQPLEQREHDAQKTYLIKERKTVTTASVSFFSDP